jgi:hypothetical protein
MKLELTIMTLLVACATASAETTLTTNYYETAVNIAPRTNINFRQWTVSRSGEAILIREERDLSSNGKWAQRDQMVMHEGKRVIHFLSLEGSKSIIYYPDANLTIIQADWDRNGSPEHIVLLGQNEKPIEILAIDDFGNLNPVSDEELASTQKLLTDFSEALKDF